MARIVLDTNVIISAALFGGVPEKTVKKILGGSDMLILSAYIIEETTRILHAKFLINSDKLRLFQQTLSVAEMQYFQPFLSVVSDDPDNRILETAVKGNADYIVTGDKLLLDLGNFRRIKIIRPAEFESIT